MVNKPDKNSSEYEHRTDICGKCGSMPEWDPQDRLDCGFMYGIFHGQSHISRKNLKSLKIISNRNRGEISEIAKLIMEAARYFPGRRKRISLLYYNHRALFDGLVRLGMLGPWVERHYDDEEAWDWEIAEH
jgi:hypothetical protein